MSKFIDITGQRFGKLTVVECVGPNKYKQIVWKCHCDCGNDCFAVTGSLRSGDKTSCGCRAKNGDLRRGTGRKVRFIPDVDQNVLRCEFGNDGWCVCDLSDYDLVKDLHFYYSRDQRIFCTDTTGKRFYLSRYLLGITDPAIEVDHIDGDVHNNRRSNLRVCSRKHNALNHPRVRGYFYNALHNRWCVSIKLAGAVWRRSYTTEDEARIMRRVMEHVFYGEFAPCREDDK